MSIAGDAEFKKQEYARKLKRIFNKIELYQQKLILKELIEISKKPKLPFTKDVAVKKKKLKLRIIQLDKKIKAIEKHYSLSTKEYDLLKDSNKDNVVKNLALQIIKEINRG